MDYRYAEVTNEKVTGFLSEVTKNNKVGILYMTGLKPSVEFFSLASNPAIKKHIWFGLWTEGGSKDFRTAHELQNYPAIMGFFGNSDTQMEYAEYEGDQKNYA